MKAGQITAKLRDAVSIEFYEDGNERAQYKNIDIPDSLKELEMADFKFITPENGKITFRLFFAPGILPTEFPPAREKMTRAQKARAKATKVESAPLEIPDTIDDNEETEEPVAETTEPPAEDAAPAIPEYRFNVTGEQRKALVAAISEIMGESPKYLGAPSFAFGIGAYRVDKTGTLTGESSAEMLAALAEHGFTLDDGNAA